MQPPKKYSMQVSGPCGVIFLQARRVDRRTVQTCAGCLLKSVPDVWIVIITITIIDIGIILGLYRDNGKENGNYYWV